MSTWYEREEDELVRQVNAGEITRKEFDRAMRDINQAMRDMAAQEAQEAYDRAMEGY